MYHDIYIDNLFFFFFSFVHKFYLRKSSTNSETKQYDCQCVNSLNLETVRYIQMSSVDTIPLNSLAKINSKKERSRLFSSTYYYIE